MNMKKIAALLAVAVMAANMSVLAAEEEKAVETAEDVVLIAETEETVEETTEETTEEVAEDAETVEETTEGLTDGAEGEAEEVVIEEVEETVVYPENAMVVNGADTGKTVVVKEEIKYVPVRAMCEAMGMEVQWDNDNHIVTIVDLPLYITFSPYKDGFTFARTAPMMLGTAPFLTEGTTYVPLAFITDLLNATYSFADNGAILIDRIVDKTVAVKVTAKAEEDGNTVLTVEDAERGEVVVVLSPETIIENQQGEAKTADDIAVDAEIKIEYSEAMTMSIPPMTNAVKIVVADAAEEVAENEEVVEEATEEVAETQEAAETEETVEETTEEVAE